MTVTRKKPPAAKSKGGRPQHQPTAQERKLVELLSGMSVPQLKIAEVLGVAQKTMLKHYANELNVGAAKVEAQLISNMFRLAGGRDGTALKANMFLLNCRFGWTQYAPPPPSKEPVLGKKEQAMLDAETAHEGNEWGELLAQAKAAQVQ